MIYFEPTIIWFRFNNLIIFLKNVSFRYINFIQIERYQIKSYLPISHICIMNGNFAISNVKFSHENIRNTSDTSTERPCIFQLDLHSKIHIKEIL